MALRAVLFVLLMGVASGALADPLTFNSVTNTSDADEIQEGPFGLRESRSVNLGTSAVTTVGLASSFTNQFGWMLASLTPVDETSGLVYLKPISYELSFTVDDPFSVGYTLQIDTSIRGYATAAYTNGITGSQVDATSGTMLGYIDTGSGFGVIFDLSLGTTGHAQADATDTADNDLVDMAKSYNAGVFVGTKTFVLQFSSRPSPMSSAVMQNGTQGEAALRFGLDPTQTDFVVADYANAPDGEPASDHGHFVTVKSTYLQAPPDPEPVPEPGTMLLIGSGLAGLAATRRRRRARN